MPIFQSCSYLIRLLQLNILICGTFFLLSCSQQPKVEGLSFDYPILSTKQWHQQQLKLKRIKAFEVSGTLHYTSSEENQRLRFRWQSEGDKHAFTLFTSFNKPLFSFMFSQAEAQAKMVNQETYYGTDANLLAQQIIGQPLPVLQLRYWLTGQNDPSSPARVIRNDAEQFIQQFLWNRWQVYYLSYELLSENTHPLYMPKALLLQGENSNIHIQLQSWRNITLDTL